MGNNDYDQSGQYTNTLTNRNGCDSIVTLNLTVNTIDRVTLNESICEGDTYSMGNNDYDQSGQYTVTLSNRNGCDSIVTLNLTVNPTDALTIIDTIYQGESYSFNGANYTEAGIYTANLTNKLGCDSVVTLNLALIPNEQPQVLTQVVDMKIKIGDTLDVSIDLEGDIFYDSDDTLLDYNYEIENGNFVAWANFILNNGILEIDATPELSDTGCYEITIMAIDPFGQIAADTFNLCVVKNYTDISDFTVNKLNAVMYPNPTNGIVTVDFDRIINDKIEVYAISAAGDQVFKRRYFGPTEQITIDLSGKVSGIYFIVIQTENRKITKELIINEH